MRFDKKGQFFLLAAVIISAVVISFGISSNKATVREEPSSFRDFSYEMKREVGAVIDYEIYSDFDPSADLDDFVDLLAADIRDGNPELNFMFIYGNNTNMTLRNYGSIDAYTSGGVLPGANAGAFSRICVGGLCQSVDSVISNFNAGVGVEYLSSADMAGSNTIDVTISGKDLSFDISKYRQVIFIMQKEVDDENFVAVG